MFSSWFNDLSQFLGLIGALIAIIQYFTGRDKKQRISELEETIQKLSSHIHNINQNTLENSDTSIDIHENEVFINKLKHQMHSHDRLFKTTKYAVAVFSTLVFIVLASTYGEEYYPMIIPHVFGIFIVGWPISFILRFFLKSKMKTTFHRANFVGKQLDEFHIWINNQPWVREESKIMFGKYINSWAGI